jgi:hypothetical protein
VGTPPRTWHLQEDIVPTIPELAAAAGVTQAVPPDEWLRQVKLAATGDSAHPLAPYVGFLQAWRGGGSLDPAAPPGGGLDSRHSWQVLRDLGVEPMARLDALLPELT